MACLSCGSFSFPGGGQYRYVKRGLARVRVPIPAKEPCNCDHCAATGGACPIPEREAGLAAVPPPPAVGPDRRVRAQYPEGAASPVPGAKRRTIDYIATYSDALSKAKAKEREAGDPVDPFSDENNDGRNDASDAELAVQRLNAERQRALAAARTPAETAATNARFDALTGPEKQRIMRAAAERAGADDATTARLIQTGITGGLAAFNAALAGSYGVEVARINAARDVEIARITGRSGSQDELLATLRREQLALTPAPAPAPATDNTPLYVGGALAIALAVSASKKKGN